MNTAFATNFRAECEALLRTVCAPDLDGLPLYVVARSELAADMTGDESYAGYFGTLLDLAARDAIGDRWAGRGPAVMVCDRAAAASGLQQYRRSARNRQTRRRRFADAARGRFLAIGIHEAAHAILFRPTSVAADRPPPRTVALARVAYATPTDVPAVPECPPFAYHEWRFIRTATHLFHRAAALLPPRLLLIGDLFDGPLYGLSCAWGYREALGDEPDRFAGRRLLDVVDTPPPPAFAERWLADVRRWAAAAPDRDAAADALTRPTVTIPGYPTPTL